MLTGKTPIIELHEQGIANLTKAAARKLAIAVANYAGRSDIYDATARDLLGYLPMRYEDRSNLVKIEDLADGVEASLDLYVRVAGGFRVGKNRGPKAPPLFIFEVTASDAERISKPVVVWWFVSGKAAFSIINYWKEKFVRGT